MLLAAACAGFETAPGSGSGRGPKDVPCPQSAYSMARSNPIRTSEEAGAPQTSYPADLSARKVEVLRLVARGMTNTQVAQELFISLAP